MSDESKQKSLAMTPQILSEKLGKVLEDMKTLAASNAEGYYVAKYDLGHKQHLHKEEPDVFSENVAAFIPTHRMKELCPELYEQLINPALAHSDRKNKFINFVGLDPEKNDITYSEKNNAVNIGMGFLESTSSMEEAISILAISLKEKGKINGAFNSSRRSQRGGVIGFL